MQNPETTGDRQPFDTSGTPAQHASTPERPAKRQRLSLACNECRKRKVKCDAEMPKCKNCRIRGNVCETTDPKHPELVVVRKYGLDTDLSENGFDNDTTPVPDPFEPEQREPSNMGRGTSWIARSYRAHQALHSTSTTELPQDTRSSFNNGEPVSQQQHDSHESPDITINIDNSERRQKLMGSSSLQSFTMFLDLYLQKSRLAQIGPCFRYGMSFAEEYLVSLTPSLPDLPPSSLVETYFDAFIRNIHPLYPILDLDHFSADLQRIRSYQDANWSPSGGFAGLKLYLRSTDVPVLACIYGAISLGADEAAGSLTAVGDNFLTAAYSLYAHLIGLPHLSSAQALILIMLALRGRGKDGQSFQVLGSAIRISHSIGLHRHLPMAHDRSHVVPENEKAHQRKSELHARIWWTCYALEKLFELEVTRPSAIPPGEHDEFAPSRIISTKLQEPLKYFIHWVALATILERISKLLYRRKRGPGSTLQLLQSIGTIDKALRDWKTLLPEEVRPDGDFYCEDVERPFATFLALQYHQALITLHRASLVLPRNQFLEDIDAHASELPYHQRLRKGASLCAASASAMIKLSAQMPDGRLQTPLYTLTQTLHGCVVLALSIFRQPQSRTVRSDLELLVTGTQLAETEYLRLGQHPDFIKACSILRESMSTYVHQRRDPTRIIQPQPTPSSLNASNPTVTATQSSWDPFAISSFSAMQDSGPLEDMSLFEGI